MPAFVDHYRVLGVAPSASGAEIRQAFRRAVHRHHADRNPHDAAAGERMRAILTARDVLCDPQQRARFDLARAGRGAPEVPVDPLFQAAARAWGQAPPPPRLRPPRPGVRLGRCRRRRRGRPRRRARPVAAGGRRRGPLGQDPRAAVSVRQGMPFRTCLKGHVLGDMP
ncbi:J domain-containing protein [Nannocystis pusilla]|uniref:J domain-containing protein n=1 Tax=Nannocystis pusilla TaxID=889268 RepID=UPI003B7E932F